jgi:hypothetical protein
MPSASLFICEGLNYNLELFIYSNNIYILIKIIYFLISYEDNYYNVLSDRY